MSRPICARISLSALRHNLHQVRLMAPESKIWAVIKANGYGHGILRVAQQLSGADGFAVASVEEALMLRQKGFIHRILLLEGMFHPDELALVEQHHLDMVVHSMHQVEWLLNAKHTLSSPINIWLKIDTGMHRLGFLPDELNQVLIKFRHSGLKFHLHFMSHFASADESETFTQQQLGRFNAITADWAESKSIANSAAIQRLKSSHLDWIRPGLMLYGAGILAEMQSRFKTVLTFQTHIISLKWIDEGESVGYGQTWQAHRRTLVAVAAAGYGDGYPRHAPSGTPVLVNNIRVPLIGRVSMDMITLDVTAMADKVNIADPVVLWGEGLGVDEVAEFSGTIGYELLCGITQRVPIKEVD